MLRRTLAVSLLAAVPMAAQALPVHHPVGSNLTYGGGGNSHSLFGNL